MIDWTQRKGTICGNCLKSWPYKYEENNVADCYSIVVAMIFALARKMGEYIYG